ncbi:MAG: HAD-IA family hydrolase [Campylobacterota bacterium]|nr:HAD-IA family hydrolase [Campylobacterota bacterium]
MKTINILFDLDGTLIDSTDAILESFDVAYKTMNYDKPYNDLIKAQIGHPLDDMFRTLGAKSEDVDNLVYHYKMHYRQINQAMTTLLPNATEAVIEASKVANLAVVTTKTSQYSIELLKHLGIFDYFDAFVGRDDVEHPKPHPQPVLKALKLLNNDYPSWMIGDTCMDMDSAKAANIHAVGVECGYISKKELEKCSNIIKSNALHAVREIVSYNM